MCVSVWRDASVRHNFLALCELNLNIFRNCNQNTLPTYVYQISDADRRFSFKNELILKQKINRNIYLAEGWMLYRPVTMHMDHADHLQYLHSALIRV